MNILLEALKEIRDKGYTGASYVAMEAIKKWEALAEENNTLSEKLEMLNRSINAADPSGYDVVIKDLRKQIKSIIQSIPPYKGGENKKWEDSSGKETGMRGWRKYNDLPNEAGLYVCECHKKGNGETSQTVTYGQYIKGFPFIKVDEEKYGKVVLWLDESNVAKEDEGKEKCPVCGRSVFETPFCITDDMKKEKTTHTLSLPALKEDTGKEDKQNNL